MWSQVEVGYLVRLSSLLDTSDSPSLPGPQNPFDAFPLSGSLRTILPRNKLALRTYGAGRVVAAIKASYFCLWVTLLGVVEDGVSSPLTDGVEEGVEGPALLGVVCCLPTTRDFGAGGAYVG